MAPSSSLDQGISTSLSTLNLHPLTLTLLKKRGVKEEEIEDFLNPAYEKHISDPFLILGMKKAVTRIVEAIENQELICIYSDYDCDGIPGGVLLREFFDGIGYPVEIYIPHRHNEGYGVHIHAIDALKEKGVTLIITVDSGITNIEEAVYAKKVGIDLIITDHHLPITKENCKPKSKKKLIQVVPDAVAVLNSKQDDCTYPDKMLCGCAVAWKLSCAVLTWLRNGVNNTKVKETVGTLPEGWEKWMLDLVGISTIADMVPLQNENRALAYFGLKVLQKTRRPGLLHMFNEQRVKKEHLTEDDISFTIAPRVNAASRMGDPIQAHLMLYEKNPKQAQTYASDLEALNTLRKSEVKDIVSTLSFDHELYKNDVIVVGDMSWGPGVLGLIAQKIIDETGKPVFVWGQGEDKSQVKGSCRSLGDVHVVDLMAHVGHEVFIHWGGHEAAGGFAVALENIPRLSDALNLSLQHIEQKNIHTEQVIIDEKLTFDDINETTYKAINILAPFGEGNPKPVFSFENVTPHSVRRFGKKNEHLEIVYIKETGQVKAIQFFVTKETEERAVKPHTLLANLEKSYFGFKSELRLRIIEIR